MTDDIDNDGTTLHESGGVGLPGLPKLPHADLWVIPGDDTFDDRGFIDAMAWQEGEFSKPLFSERQLRAYGEQCAIAALAVPQAPLQAEPVPVVASEPKVWVSPEQFAAFTSDPAGDHGHYLPMRRKPAGKFTQPLYTTPQAEPAVAEQAPDYDLKGYALAMRVMQSDLYRMLDDRERAECDALIRTGQGAPPPPDEPSDSLYCRQVARLRLATQSTPPPESAGQPRLKVWLTKFPESNGKTNWTALLVREDDSWDGLIGNCGGITIDRGEFWNRIAYEAERAKFLLGERDDEPCILDYSEDIKTPDEWKGERAANPTAPPPESAAPPKNWRSLLGEPPESAGQGLSDAPTLVSRDGELS